MVHIAVTSIVFAVVVVVKFVKLVLGHALAGLVRQFELLADAMVVAHLRLLLFRRRLMLLDATALVHTNAFCYLSKFIRSVCLGQAMFFQSLLMASLLYYG